MFDFFNSYIIVACGNYFKTIVNVTKTTIMLQLMYTIHTCDHVTCSHLQPLWDAFAISF
jgi:hypothetical protein